MVVDLSQTLSKECVREPEERKPRRDAGTLYCAQDKVYYVVKKHRERNVMNQVKVK
jgi:hypothetical protein